MESTAGYGAVPGSSKVVKIRVWGKVFFSVACVGARCTLDGRGRVVSAGAGISGSPCAAVVDGAAWAGAGARPAAPLEQNVDTPRPGDCDPNTG